MGGDVDAYDLGLAIGKLTKSIDALTERLESVEQDMVTFRAIMNGGKGAVIFGVLLIALAGAGVAGLVKAIKDLLL